MNNGPVLVSDEADADITDAARWYAERSQLAAGNFIEEAYRCIGFIALHPNGAPRVHGFIRQLPLNGFPFVIMYRPMRDHIIVLRVFHTSMDPKKKFGRRQ